MNEARAALVDHHLTELRRQWQSDQRDVNLTTELGIPRRDLQRYSLSKAILADADSNLATKAGLEAEVSRTIAKSLGEPAPIQGFYAPPEIFARRDLTSTNDGSMLISTSVADTFVGTLATQMVSARLGVRVVENLVNNIAFPIASTGTTAYWLAEDGVSAITPSQSVVQQRAASPKSIAALTICSRQLLQQSGTLGERFVVNEVTTAIANALDKAVFSGSGTSGEPHGIVGTTNVNVATGTSIGWGTLAKMQSDTIDANLVTGLGTFGYVTTGAVALVLAGRQRFSGVDSPIWSGSLRDGQICGARAMATPAAPSATIIGGDWAGVIVAMWPAVRIGADPYTNFRDGRVSIRALLMCDVILAKPAAFTTASGVT